MKREVFVTMMIALLVMTVGDIACAQNVPLIIDPDKVDEYLAERKDTTNVYDVVEQMPGFPGGTQKLIKFIEENMRYPKECAEKGIYGRVIVAFVVERNGQLSNIKVVKSVHPALDKEALRIVNLMPRWIPGRQNGKTFRVKYLIPIKFSEKKMVRRKWKKY
jgi:protein TonB